MATLQVPQQLSSPNAGYFTQLFNLLKQIVAAILGIQTSAPIVLTGRTPGLAPGESVVLSYPLVSGHGYMISWTAIAMGPPGATPDVSTWNALGTSQPVIVFQESGTFSAPIVGSAATQRQSTVAAASWTLVPSLGGEPGAQTLQFTFTDVGSTEVVNISINLSVCKTPFP